MDWLTNNWGVVIWLVCGFFAYGLLKGSFLNTIKEYRSTDGYDAIGEFLCLIVFPMGYMGLFLVIYMSVMVDRRLYWCLKAPKELTKKFWDRPTLW